MTRSSFARALRSTVPATHLRGRRRGSRRTAPRRADGRTVLGGERLEGRAVLATFAYDALAEVVSVGLADGETLTSSSQGGGNYVLSLGGGATFSGDDIAARLVGNGLPTLTIDGDLPLVRVAMNGIGTDANVGFVASTGVYVDDFTIALGTAAGDVTISSPTTFNGTAGLAVTAARSIAVLANLASGTGDILLDADDGIQHGGTFSGVVIEAASVTTAGGDIVIAGRGGDGEGFFGLQIGVSIVSAGLVRAGDNGATHGTVTIDGIGGDASGDGPFSHGIYVDATSAVRSTGGFLALTGTGGARDGRNDGVLLEGTVATLTGAGPGDTGAITIVGNGGGSPGSEINRGVVLAPTAGVTSVAGAISITGDGGSGTGTPTSSPGVLFDAATLTSATGDITLTADDFAVGIGGGALSTSATVTVRNLLAGQILPITAASVPMLQAIGASRIVVGRSDPGLLPVITQEGAASLALTGTALELRGADIQLRAAITTAGAPQTYAGPVRLGVPPDAGDVTLTGTTITLGGTVTGNDAALAIVGNAIVQDTIAGLRTVAVSGTTSLGGDVGSSGGQTYGGPVTLTRSVRLDTGTGTGDVTFASTLDGPFNVTIAAGAGTVLLDGIVGGGQRLGAIVFESAGAVNAPRSVSIDGTIAGAGPRGIDVAAGINQVSLAGGGTITGSAMQGIRFSGSSTGSLVRGFAITGAGISGIKFSPGDYTGTTVIGNTIDGAGHATYGIRLHDATGLSIGGGIIGDGNRVSGSYQGLYATGDLAGSVMVGNMFIANTSGVVLDAATGLGFGNGNQVRSSPAFGIYVGGISTGTTLQGNTLVENAVGVYLDQARGVRIVDNVMVRNAAQGLFATGACDGTIALDNSIYGGGGVGMYGVYLAGARGLALGTEELGNDIAGTTQGVFAFGTLTGTTIAGNLVEQNQTGIVLLGAKSLSIAAGNRIVSNSAWGLYAAGDCALSTVKGSTFQANKSGVYMNAVLGMTVGTETAGDGNTISANQFGLFAIGVSTGTSVLGNTISGNTTNITVDATAAATGTFQAV